MKSSMRLSIIAFECLGSLLLSQLLAAVISFAIVWLSAEEGLGAGFSMILIFMLLAPILLLVGNALVFIINKVQWIWTLGIQIALLMAYCMVIVFVMVSW